MELKEQAEKSDIAMSAASVVMHAGEDALLAVPAERSRPVRSALQYDGWYIGQTKMLGNIVENRIIWYNPFGLTGEKAFVFYHAYSEEQTLLWRSN